jgi:hypothetical protein
VNVDLLSTWSPIDGDDAMMLPRIDGPVRLKQDIPDLGLLRGDVGLVRSTWFNPNTAYEIEFQPGKSTSVVRTLLGLHQIEEAPAGSSHA